MSAQSASEAPLQSNVSVPGSGDATVKEEALPDQCGLYDDGIDSVPKQFPPRKRITEETQEQQKQFQAILDQIFSNDAVIGQRVDFDPNDVLLVLRTAWIYLKSEPMFIEDVAPPITVVGNLHGHLHDLHRIFKCRSVDGKPSYLCDKFLFLGGYVDSGRQSLEVIMALFILKILYPDNFILLRGNHEFTAMNAEHGLAEEMAGRFGKAAAKKLYSMMNAVFEYLSLCAVIGGKAFCVHGGVSTTSFNRTELRNLRKPVTHITDNNLVLDMMWSDPADGLQGTCFNEARQTSILYGEDFFSHCMHRVDCLFMLRGHSRITAGCEVTWDRCFTVFSATCMNLKRNKGAFITLNKDMKMSIVVLDVDEERFTIEKLIMKEKKKPKGKDAVAEDETGTIMKMKKDQN